MKVAFIGCGNIAGTHLLALRSVRGVEELHLYDTNLQAAEGMARRWGESAFVHTSVEVMLRAARPDVVHVLTPPRRHFDLVARALGAGAHVFVEKPLTERYSEAERLVDAASRNGLSLCVGYAALFMPAVRAALEIIESGTFGAVLGAYCYFGQAEKAGTIPYGTVSHWAYGLRGGVLENIASHPISLLVRLLGATRRCSVHLTAGHVLPNDMPDTVQLALEAEKGMGSVLISMGRGNAERTCVVYLEKGTIIMDLARQLCLTVKKGRVPLVDKLTSAAGLGVQYLTKAAAMAFWVATGRFPRNPGLVGIIVSFYESLGKGAPMPISRGEMLEMSRLEDIFISAVEARMRRSDGRLGALSPEVNG